MANSFKTELQGVRFGLDTGFTWLARASAMVPVVLLVAIGWVIGQQAWPAMQAFGLSFLWGQDWDVGAALFGALPYIYGTLVSAAIALLLAVPVGLSVAILTTESFLPTWVREPVAFLVELIAAIPSVIVGLWGIFVLIPFLMPMQTWLFDHWRWVPLFSTEPYGPGMLTAGVILAIMILPTLAALGRDVLLALPPELRMAAMAVGATRWETIAHVNLPAASAGILGAVTLGLGRALGETMAVTMVIGNSPQISASLLDLGYTIPAVLANQFAEAVDELHLGALMYLALVLFLLTLAVNVVAVLMVRAVGMQTP
ncbi:phosphate ABC transporter permease subunit PstC [Synechococcales cyanobacterium C]|uniref:Phosphate transport system permease protein n=1 Tax=Petrachloros mirabilis ULC683 TaxID=2781853 RepID=A0A8K2A7W9_9CYAN|nr:phosphate ABC transporter permease subunit PstC [Petrachloros mirabilis]NCJ07341.1 phosphate ABC transporter permease subunit PstC [Petrachloros mirabilis ULC683]